MTSGSLIDLDPPDGRERRWPFYLAWAMGGLVVGAVLVGQLPASSARLASPRVTAPAAAPTMPAAPRLRVAPAQLPPARP